MSTARKATLVAALLVAGSMTSVAHADTSARYALQRIPMGPRPDQYILVRVFDSTQAPYALTGTDARPRTREAAVRHFPSHPKGTHGEY